jgi:hypothetical protein
MTLTNYWESKVLEWLFTGKVRPVKYYTHPLFGELISFYQASNDLIETEWTKAPFISFVTGNAITSNNVMVGLGISPKFTPEMFETHMGYLANSICYMENNIPLYFSDVILEDGTEFRSGTPITQVDKRVWIPVAVGIGK